MAVEDCQWGGVREEEEVGWLHVITPTSSEVVGVIWCDKTAVVAAAAAAAVVDDDAEEELRSGGGGAAAAAEGKEGEYG